MWEKLTILIIHTTIPRYLSDALSTAVSQDNNLFGASICNSSIETGRYFVTNPKPVLLVFVFKDKEMNK